MMYDRNFYLMHLLKLIAERMLKVIKKVFECVNPISIQF